MNDHGAAMVLDAIAGGVTDKLNSLCEWIAQREELGGRYLPEDIKPTVLMAAERVAAGAAPGTDEVLAVIADLAGRPESVLAAVFSSRGPSRLLALADAYLATAADLMARVPEGLLGEPSDRLAVAVRHPARGRLGAIRAAAWMQTVLGAVGLAAYARSKALAPVAACPTIALASYSGGTLTHARSLESATRFPVDETEVRIEALFEDPECKALMVDATAREASDLAQARLTVAVRWLQSASSAVAAADAIVLLGVALETIAGDQNKGNVVERITKRAAIFLASGAPAEDQDDIYYEQRKRAESFYNLRSLAAHGRYDEIRGNQSKKDSERLEFHRFVADVCLGFRRHSRARSMLSEDDFMKWWKRVEIKGAFA